MGGQGELIPSADDGSDGSPLVLLGVTAGVAAYRSCELVRILRRGGRRVQVAVTPDVERFVGHELLAALSGRPVLRDGSSEAGDFPHLDAAREAAALVIAPCTANTLAKLAAGLADNVVTQSALSTAAPVLLAPAMNVRMWEHAATRANVATLRARGAALVGPEEGELAEGEWGMGRMSEPPAIAAALDALLASPADGPLAGRAVLVTAGGTREPIDDVRVIANRSSGRMGAALAEAAAARGARVTTVLGSASVAPAAGEVVRVETAGDMEREVRARAASADVVLMAAAVADFRARPHAGKLDRRSGLVLELEPTADILASLGHARPPGQVLVGFAAESGDGLERAREKRLRKGVDLIVLNDVSRGDIGFDSDHNEVVLVGAGGERHVERAPKAAVAAAILDEVERLMGHG